MLNPHITQSTACFCDLQSVSQGSMRTSSVAHSGIRVAGRSRDEETNSVAHSGIRVAKGGL